MWAAERILIIFWTFKLRTMKSCTILAASVSFITILGKTAGGSQII